MAARPGFFDLQERLARLSAKGAALERLNAVVDFTGGEPAGEGQAAGVGDDRAHGANV